MKLFATLNGTRTGIILILLISAALLFSDIENRKLIQRKIPKVAIFKLSSRPLLDNTEKGMIDGLEDRGFIDGKTINITRYNAENDLPTANIIAQEIITRRFDMVLTASTPIITGNGKYQ